MKEKMTNVSTHFCDWPNVYRYLFLATKTAYNANPQRNSLKFITLFAQDSISFIHRQHKDGIVSSKLNRRITLNTTMAAHCDWLQQLRLKSKRFYIFCFFSIANEQFIPFSVWKWFEKKKKIIAKIKTDRKMVSVHMWHCVRMHEIGRRVRCRKRKPHCTHTHTHTGAREMHFPIWYLFMDVTRWLCDARCAQNV